VFETDAKTSRLFSVTAAVCGGCGAFPANGCRWQYVLQGPFQARCDTDATSSMIPHNAPVP